MFIVLIVIFLAYFIILAKYNPKQKEQHHQNELEISVIIAAKNEESNITLLIQSLNNQMYNKDNYEVILIDDNSSDNTFNTAAKESSEMDNFKVIKADNKIFEGKRGALNKGIAESKYENILITDADCIPEPGWLKAYSSQFNSGKSFIMGVSPYYQTNSLVNKIACYDNLWVHILTFSFAEIGFPYSAAARSLGFTKSTFNKIGGYTNTLQTISGDDDLLLREAVKHKISISTFNDKNAFVFTKSKTSLPEFIRQKSRHSSTSHYYSTSVKFVLGIWYLINIVMLSSIFLYPIYPTVILIFATKYFGNFVISQLHKRKFGYSFFFSELFYLQIIYELLLVVNFIRSLFVKNKW